MIQKYHIYPEIANLNKFPNVVLHVAPILPNTAKSGILVAGVNCGYAKCKMRNKELQNLASYFSLFVKMFVDFIHFRNTHGVHMYTVATFTY